MKKKLLIISIISTALAVIGLVLAEIAFHPAGLGIGAAFASMFAFGKIFAAHDYIWLVTALLSIAGLIVIIVFWVLHLVKLIKIKAKQWIAVDVLGIVGGLIAVIVFAGLLNKYAFVNFEIKTHKDIWASSFIDALLQYHPDWGHEFTKNWLAPLIEDQNYFGLIGGILAIAAAIAGWILGLKALVVSRKVMEGKVKENPEEEEAEEPAAVAAKEGEGAPTSEDELRGAENAELDEDDANGKKVGPYVIQYFNYGPAPKAEEEKKPAAEEDDEEMLTSDDLRKIIREEMHIDPNAPKTTPLTADEVREIVKEEIEKAFKDQAPAQNNASMEQQQNAAIKQLQDNQLTPEQVRTVVSQELDKRSLASQPEKVEKKEAPQPEPKPEPAPAPVVVQVVTAPAPTPAPAPAPAPAPVGEPKKVVRAPFPERPD